MHIKIVSNFRNSVEKFLTSAVLLALLVACAGTSDEDLEDVYTPAGGILRLGDQMRVQGDDEGAMHFYASAVQRSPDNIKARRKLAEVLELHNLNKDASDQYAALIELDPDNAEYHADYGRTLIKIKNFSAAKDQYEAALRLKDSDPRSLNGLGIALDMEGNHTAAQEKYLAALELEPQNLNTINNLGHSYILTGAYGEAIKVLEPQAQNAAAPPTLRQNLAKAYAQSGREDEAHNLLALDLSPAEAKKKVAQYRATPSKPVEPPKPYANLGSFTNSDLAQRRADEIKQNYAKEVEAYVIGVTAKVEKKGGTPDFYARVDGFKSITEAQSFCSKLSNSGAFCRAREDRPLPQ